ncbi:unnamed protein product [Arabidopsis halleri]
MSQKRLRSSQSSSPTNLSSSFLRGHAFLIFRSLFIQKWLLQDGSGPRCFIALKEHHFSYVKVKLVCIRVTKENRTAGILENHAEGERYAEHSLRKFVRNKAPQIMPSINGFFSDPKY